MMEPAADKVVRACFQRPSLEATPFRTDQLDGDDDGVANIDLPALRTWSYSHLRGGERPGRRGHRRAGQRAAEPQTGGASQPSDPPSFAFCSGRAMKTLLRPAATRHEAVPASAQSRVAVAAAFTVALRYFDRKQLRCIFSPCKWVQMAGFAISYNMNKTLCIIRTEL